MPLHTKLVKVCNDVWGKLSWYTQQTYLSSVYDDVGEIATDLPDNKITLIHSHPQLMDDALRSEFRN